MEISETDWATARSVFTRAVQTSLHCSIATVNPDGTPHVTPIGSVLLGDRGTAMYFDVFNRRLARNIAHDPRVTVLAVDSGRLMWARSLLRGSFVSPPGMRLTGVAGPPRDSTPAEVHRLHRRIGPALRTAGGRLMWRSLPRVREITVERVEMLRIGPMTAAVNRTTPRPTNLTPE